MADSEGNGTSLLRTLKQSSDEGNRMGHVAALVGSYKNGLLPFESTMEQTT